MSFVGGPHGDHNGFKKWGDKIIPSFYLGTNDSDLIQTSNDMNRLLFMFNSERSSLRWTAEWTHYTLVVSPSLTTGLTTNLLFPFLGPIYQAFPIRVVRFALRLVFVSSNYYEDS